MTSTELLEHINSNKHEFEIFLSGVEAFFQKYPCFANHATNPIHSIKSRMKSRESIEGEIIRKQKAGVQLTRDNIFYQLSDLAGLRILLLHHGQFKLVHEALLNGRINTSDWFFREKPKAYSWDIEYSNNFQKIGIQTEVNESYYTSVHYLVTPKEKSYICCEIQVRTLFEEVWGEVSHKINYPKECENQSCKDQLKVLARLSSTGSRLVDSIFATLNQ